MMGKTDSFTKQYIEPIGNATHKIGIDFFNPECMQMGWERGERTCSTRIVLHDDLPLLTYGDFK